MLTTEQFNRMRRLALRLAGIELFERHRELLGRRSRRLGILDCAGMDSLLGAAEEQDADATRRVVSLLTTNFTGFFRHPWHFDVAAEHALSAAHRRSEARLWSAAAATGEEPYSIAMVLIEVFRHDDPPATILATDIDVDALAVAERGEYGERVLRALEPERRARFFTEKAGKRWGVAPAVRRLVEFQALNLADVTWRVDGPFDVIFCRNVLMYLEGCHRYAVLERMASLLAPDGLLILDLTEHLGKTAHLFTLVSDGVYSRQREFRPPDIASDFLSKI
ncbi:MAG: protein-glutamate O-methyltransferase CheR [Verrucomicrobiota bacterium]